MEFALNYSHEAAALVRDGRLAIDRFKVPDWPEQIGVAGALRPVYVHFPLHAATLPDDAALNAVDRMAAETCTTFINVHLMAYAREFPDAEVAAAAMEAGVRRLVQRFGADRVIVETVPLGDPEEGFAPIGTDPQFVRRVVEVTGCGFLLDLSHARLTARATGVDARRYIEQLPVDRLRELHVTGLGMVGGKLKDHMPLTDSDWTELEWVAGRIRGITWAAPRMIACEYGGTGPAFRWRSDAAVIEAQVPRMREMLGV
ncbi:MAG TPA: DUF692 family protein [Tepidisphaeraceae bacterium]|nr:DUF692 family protein [Tepidisphaeraceae bacterium]